MLSLIIQISIVSIIFIFLVHHLLCFFKTTLTVPKIKDLVNSPNTKYQHIFDTIAHKNESSDTNYGEESEYSIIDLLPSGSDSTNINTNLNTNPSKDTSMKDELKHFLKKQLNNDETTNNTFINANTNTNTNTMYSNY